MLVTSALAAAQADGQSLRLERTITLGDIGGRIDHLAADVAHHRLYVAELGNNSIGIVDLDSKSVRTVRAAKEPQGAAYDAASDTVFVASGDDGSIALFRGSAFAPIKSIDLGDDADNVRIETNADRVWVGYGGGALAALDGKSYAKLFDIPLKGHPESFQLETDGKRIFVNVPDNREIAVIDRDARKQVSSWSTRDLRANYPIALDAESRTVFSVFRTPATIVSIAMDTGVWRSQTPTCGDADDVFVDAKRRRLYVICGEGFVDAFKLDRDTLERVDRVPTQSGARTGLFVAELDRLFVAARKGTEPAMLWVFEPAP
jgi:DNA-binding beta-propeller fold protein YncE